MGMHIESSNEKPYGWVINEKGQGLVHAITQEQLAQVSREGSAFYISTDFINLTTTSVFSGILYFKNTTQLNFNISILRTCGVPSQQWKWIKDPTTGTLISNAVAGITNNINHTSGNMFVGDVFVGADNNTVTDGNLFAQWINGGPDNSIQDFGGAIILAPNNAMALTCKPGSAGDVCVTLLGFFGNLS